MKLNILIIITMISVVALFSLGQSFVFGKQINFNNFNNSDINKNLLGAVNSSAQQDTRSPSINITYPPYPNSQLSGNMTLKGTANDSNGIKAISAAAYMFPLNGSTKITPVIAPSLISHGSLSNWSIPFTFKQSGVYKILVTIRDNANNTGHAQTTVIVPMNDPSLKN